MSRSKKDRNIPNGNGLASDAQLAEIIADALREDFGDTPSSIKRIGRLTGANLRAIKNWYVAKNAPSSRYLLLLARMSPSILQFILTQVGGEDLWDVFDLFQRNVLKPPVRQEPQQATDKVAKDIEKSVTSRSPRERQAWFLERVVKGEEVSAELLMERWNVNLRTARRDISGLIVSGQIVFKGRRKTGRYELTPPLALADDSPPHAELDRYVPPPRRRRGRPPKGAKV